MYRMFIYRNAMYSTTFYTIQIDFDAFSHPKRPSRDLLSSEPKAGLSCRLRPSTMTTPQHIEQLKIVASNRSII